MTQDRIKGAGKDVTTSMNMLGQECLMGMDVGKRLHVVIRETGARAGRRLWETEDR